MLLFSSFSYIIGYNVFKPIFIANEIIIPYGLNPFDICQDNPILWYYIKLFFVIFYLFSNIIISNFLINHIFRFIEKLPIAKIKKFNKSFSKREDVKNNELINILIGENEIGEEVYIPEKGLYQNFLITRNNRFRENKFCNVPIYKTVYGI